MATYKRMPWRSTHGLQQRETQQTLSAEVSDKSGQEWHVAVVSIIAITIIPDHR